MAVRAERAVGGGPRLVGGVEQPEDLAAGRIDAKFARLAAFEIGRADSYFKQARSLDRMLSTDGRLAFRAMFAAYRALFAAVCRAGDRILTQRVRPKRAQLVAATLAGVVSGPRP